MTERELLALVLVDDGEHHTATIADDDGTVEHVGPSGPDALAERLRAIDGERRPRWVWWGHDTAVVMAQLGVRTTHCWDLAAVHRLVAGGWRSDPARVWATAHGLDPSTIPSVQPDDLFHAFEDRDPDQHVDDAGHLAPEWAAGAWSETPDRRATWARAALDVRRRQAELIGAVAERPAIDSTVRVESAASILAAELEVEGLPFDRAVGDDIVAGFVGPRPSTPADERAAAADRDRRVLDHVPDGDQYDLRSPEQVRSMLRRCGIEVPDTQSWRLERMVDAHPVVRPLLEWRRAERISTTFGYRWMDEHLHATPGGRTRLHGVWSSSDGAAGRMTATAGLHNMPAELRPAVLAEPGHLFVRADLGQIEPRILAAVSADEALVRATADDDMYAPVAARLRVEREVAKVAVLGAMYGQTTGVGAAALRGLERAYPVAMRFLQHADETAQGGNDLRTHGGRLVRMSAAGDDSLSATDARGRAAARGRYGRNAMIQGAAAEFFKVWAVLVRVRTEDVGAHIVLCLHDELLVHTPEEHADTVAATVESCLDEAAARWAPPGGRAVRFVADTSVIRRWSDAS